MKIGQLLTIKEVGKESETTYHSKLIDVDEQFVFISHPINIKTKKSTFFPRETEIIASFVDEQDVVFQFASKVIKPVKIPIPVIAIKKPTNEDIHRIQRRNFMRIETAVDVAIHSKNKQFSPFTTITRDISGGGLSVIVPQGVDLKEDELLDLWLVLESDQGEHQYLNLLGHVVRIHYEQKARMVASIKFENISKLNQELLIKFCFQKEREARRKGLYS
ncbi:flagellar brake protein [Virgibacillus soli]|uniref:PilZ domain-containing protein n=1 Tax=Paracerasibacillus soli TaxID=480284 RepID=A0ABU5CPP7_9BACI|nr:flagellar brake domain-containing protein [Virgibacillus soli]MDY0408328.1 PilZ domain-containing protein [Virgibacillus soli]